MAIDLVEILRNTSMRAAHLEETEKKILRYKEDLHKTTRHLLLKCKYCYYMGRGLVGHMFTDSYCRECNKVIRNPSTDEAKLCSECAKTFFVCQWCISDLDNREKRRKL